MHLLTQSLLLKALGWALFNSLWQMGLLWLSYSLLILVFSDMTARVRHGLALMLLVIGAGWFGATIVAAWLSPEPLTASSWPSFLIPSQSSSGWLRQATYSFINTVLSYGSSIYLLILCGLILRYSNQYRQSRRLVRRGLTKLPSELRVFVASTCRNIGIQTPVRPWLSSLVDTPMTLGYLKPVILLPVAMINHLTPQQVEAILIHELAHIHRKDYLFQLLVSAVEGMFFFNPFCRLLVRHLKKERENCCDDLVLQHQYDPHSYVSALLSLATRSQSAQRMALAATGDGNRLLLQRAKRILHEQKKAGERPGSRSLILLLFTLLATMATVFAPSHHAGDLTVLSARQTTNLLHPPSILLHPPSIIAAGPVERPAVIIMSGPILVPRLIRTPKLTIRLATPVDVNRKKAHYPPAASDDPDESQAEDNGVLVNTAGDDDESLTPAYTAQQEQIAPDPDIREYSIAGAGVSHSNVSGSNISGSNASGATPARPGQEDDAAPFVPNSSFSFKYTTGDSSGSPDNITYLQQSGQKDIQAAIKQLQLQLSAQLKALSALQTKSYESVHLRQELRIRELNLQHQYLQKISVWQKKLEKVTHFKMIVYI
jgi:beta-lactamase regulating signal transducer with metallopeptidase domain